MSESEGVNPTGQVKQNAKPNSPETYGKERCFGTSKLNIFRLFNPLAGSLTFRLHTRFLSF